MKVDDTCCANVGKLGFVSEGRKIILPIISVNGCAAL